MRTISSVSTGRTRRFTTLACTTRLLPKFRNILILLYQVHYIIAGSISAFQLVSTLPSVACQHVAFGLRLSAFQLAAVRLVPGHVLRDIFPAGALSSAAERRTAPLC